MIVSQTPLRISFFSGGSDLPSFYEKEEGAALSSTIDKYIFVSVHRTPNLGIRMMYDEVEDVNNIDDMQHAITREALKSYNITNEITVSSISDINSKGSGLGSSSAFTVGLINSLNKLTHSDYLDEFELADTACDIEMNRCKFPVGKQDQYAAAFGGLNLFKFHRDSTVTVESITLNDQTLEKLQSNLLLVHSGRNRSANLILQRQKSAMSDIDKFNLVRNGRDKAYTAVKYLTNGDTDSIGALLHESWMDKKNVVKEISEDYFDTVYQKAISAGALGGKLLGAGGGGFFIFYVSPDNRQRVISSITNSTACKVYDFSFTNVGTKIITHI